MNAEHRCDRLLQMSYLAWSVCLSLYLTVCWADARPVEHQLHRISKALTCQATEQAMGIRTADSTQVYITYDVWNMKVFVF